MTRRFSAVLGLVAGLATLLATAGPASAVHIFLSAMGQGDVTAVVIQPVGIPAIAQLEDPLTLFGSVTRDNVTGSSTFTHTFNFGVEVTGTGGASVTPNVLTVGGTAGFASLTGSVTGPGLSGPVALQPVAGSDRIETAFAAISMGTGTPYALTITGSLLPGVTAGNYTGNIGVVPLPGAALLFLTALGGLAVARRYRRREEEAEEPTGAMAA